MAIWTSARSWGTEEHVLQHHVVGQDDVRRTLQDLLADLLLGLADVHGESQRRLRIVLLLITDQRLILAVDEGVHGVDENRADGVPLWLVAEDSVDDRDQVGQALPGSSPGGDDVRLPPQPGGHRFELMPVEAEVRAKETRRLGVDHALVGQGAEGLSLLEGWVELEVGLRPQRAASQLASNEVIEALILNVDERFQIAPVLVNHVILEREDV